MNQAQKNRSAGYFPDISKIIFAASVVGPIISEKDFNIGVLVTVLAGVTVSGLFFVLSLSFEKIKKGEKND